MSKIRILMVDDEERFRTITAQILEKKGFETIVADSGQAALEKLAESPHVVVLDDAELESDVLVAAGTLVPPRKKLAAGGLYAGAPAGSIRRAAGFISTSRCRLSSTSTPSSV